MSISLRAIFTVIAAAASVVSGSNNTSNSTPAPTPATGNSTGSSDCPCLATPSTTQVKVAGKPDFVDATTYGYGCAKHDDPATYTQPASPTTANDCANATYMASAAGDWCHDEWCIVDPSDCNLHTRAVTFTADANDMFSYKTCDSTFAGNGWVGTAACAHYANSFCTASENIALGGDADCPCVTPAVSQTAATDKPDFVTGTNYGYFCRKHDFPATYSNEPAAPTVANSCIAAMTAGTTGEGEANDWCLDKWCIVAEANCNLKTRAVTFTTATTDVFSYKTCDADFAGNGWVGRVACTSNAESFCTDAENGGGTTTSDAPAGTSLVLTIVLGLCSAFAL